MPVYFIIGLSIAIPTVCIGIFILVLSFFSKKVADLTITQYDQCPFIFLIFLLGGLVSIILWPLTIFVFLCIVVANFLGPIIDNFEVKKKE